MTPRTDVEIIAHRGFSRAGPENTLAAVRAALDAGADAIEWDLQTASCGTPVLFHDPHLGRTTNGFGPVKRRTLGQLQSLDAGSWFSSEFEGERIPSFAEALDLVAPADALVYAEVKGYRELEDLDRMVLIVESKNMLGRVCFISLDFGIVDRIAGRNENLGIGYVVEDAADVDKAITKAAHLDGRGMVDFDRRLVLDDASTVARAHAAGVAVAVWTVDDLEEADRLYKAGVRRFTSNAVSDLIAWRAGSPAV